MKKDYAGFWVRLFAGLLDLMILMPLIFLLVYLTGLDYYEIITIGNPYSSYSYFGASGGGQFVDLISYAISIAYLAYFAASKKQATLGKRVMGIYIGNPDGSKLTWQKSLARALASLITSATLGLGFLLLIFTKEKTAFHDLICNTRVFHGKKHD